jgi:hypothetical protein
VDGLKLSSNASKEWSGKFEDLEKKKENLERKVKEAVLRGMHRSACTGRRPPNGAIIALIDLQSAAVKWGKH